MADTSLTPDEIKFFETGELQPGMTPADPDPLPTPNVAVPVAATPPVETPAEPTPVAVEAADILRQSLEDAQRRVGQLEANLQQLQTQQTAPKTPEVVAPDPDTDPLGAMMHQLNTVNKTVADLQAAINAQRDQQTQQTQFQQFQSQVGQLRDQFVKVTPDFTDAYSHIRNARIADLKAFGMTDDKIQQTLFQEEVTLAQNAIRFGKNPAEVMYDMAKRHGYAPKSVAAPNSPTKPDAKLAAIGQAQSAAKTLPSTPALEDITVDGLKGASDSDLDKLVRDEKTWARITGADQHPI